MRRAPSHVRCIAGLAEPFAKAGSLEGVALEPCKECQSPCANHRHAWRRGVSRSSGWVRPSRSEAMRTRSVFPVPKGWALRRRDFLLLSAAEAPTRRARLGPRKGSPKQTAAPEVRPGAASLLMVPSSDSNGRKAYSSNRCEAVKRRYFIHPRSRALSLAACQAWARKS